MLEPAQVVYMQLQKDMDRTLKIY